MLNGTILVIDDEKDLQELVRYNLEKEHYDVIVASDGRTGLDIALRHRPDLVVLDLMMPGIDGLEVCRGLRTDDRGKRIPLIMLTAKGTESDRVVGLELGADDYVVKPFSPRELVARIKALLRRSAPEPEPAEVIRRGDLMIDVGCHQVKLGEREVQLTATEFRILQFMASRPRRVLKRDEIIEAALDRDSDVFDRTIDVHITSIRRKLGKGADLVQTVRGFGYRFRDGRDD
jgi:DNA-binding response OmpR family regulator